VVSGATQQVKDGDIASLSAGKITAGTVNAEVILGTGRIATYTTRQRSELTKAGILAWNAAN
jgi:hypothetical protein